MASVCFVVSIGGRFVMSAPSAYVAACSVMLQAPVGARSLVRGLLSVNAGQRQVCHHCKVAGGSSVQCMLRMLRWCRLTASEANDHTWFQSLAPNYQ